MANQMAAFILGNRAYFEDFVTRSTYHSNRIEGNTLSYRETYAVLFNDNSIPIKTTSRELYEAINHKYAISHLLENVEAPALTETFIKELATTINKNIDEIAGYRKHQVLIRGAEHLPPAPAMVGQQMMYFVDNYNASPLEPFEKAATFHIEFERIRPFSDGNGRTGRLLINYELIRNELPPIVIAFERRADYMQMLAQQDVSALTNLLRQQCDLEQQRIETILQAPTRSFP